MVEVGGADVDQDQRSPFVAAPERSPPPGKPASAASAGSRASPPQTRENRFERADGLLLVVLFEVEHERAALPLFADELALPLEAIWRIPFAPVLIIVFDPLAIAA
ncbi:MAG: hypothetical protein WBW08_14500 [Methyloceanibacter sp.]